MVNKPEKRVNKSPVRRPKRPGRPKKGAGGIDLARIVTTAWAIVDRDGMAALSTRILAAALDVKSPALYWYVQTKDELPRLTMENIRHNSLNTAPPTPSRI